jgi:hypothetical protein
VPGRIILVGRRVSLAQTNCGGSMANSAFSSAGGRYVELRFSVELEEGINQRCRVVCKGKGRLTQFQVCIRDMPDRLPGSSLQV